MTKLLAACATVALLAGCANPPAISSNPVQDVTSALTSLGGSQLQTQAGNDISAAQYDFNQAVVVGALTSSDPAPGCLNAVATATGLGGVGPVSASFVPKMVGPASIAAVAYIRLQQASGLAGGGNISALIPVSCLALIGKLNIDGLQQINKAAIGAIPIPGVSSVLGNLPIPLANAPNASLGGK